MSIDNFVVMSFVTGLFVCSSLSILGCVSVWRKIAYIGDSISHAAIMGVLLSILTDYNLTYSLVIFSVVFSLLFYFTSKFEVSSLTVLILSYTLLSLGIISLSVLSTINIDVMSFLFGDILLINNEDLICSAILLFLTIIWISCRKYSIIFSAISEELAAVEGIKNNHLDLEYILVVSVAIALSVKILGALLVSAILVIPAVSARIISKNPIEMLVKSAIISVASLSIGFIFSYQFDLPTGPTIVLASFLLFLLLGFFRVARSQL